MLVDIGSSSRAAECLAAQKVLGLVFVLDFGQLIVKGCSSLAEAASCPHPP